MVQQDINWGVINNGGVFESLMHALLYVEDHSIVLFGRPGKDSGQDARTADGTIVYQAKYRNNGSYSGIESTITKEFEQLEKYRKPEHANYKHWKNVKKWVLYINIPLNPNDKSKWKDFIASSSELLSGIEVELMNQTVITQEVLRNPYIKDAFFLGRNRVFLGLKEAYEMLSAEDIADSSFDDKGYIGRELELSKIKEEICNSENRVVPVIGKKGSGITRFLYEALNMIGDNEWQVLWGLPASMSASNDWFKSLCFAKNTCFVIDCPDDISLVKIIIEQLGVTERKNWKVIIACRIEEHRSIINFLSNNRMITSKIEIKNLSEAESKHLVDAYYPNKFKNESKYSLFEYTKGSPYLILIIGRVANDGDVINVYKYLQTYIEGCIDGVNNVDREQCKLVLHYIALWGSIKIDLSSEQPNSVLTYLFDQGALPDSISLIINELVISKLVVRYGLNDNVYSINSPIIREQLLRNWLLDEQGEGNFKPNHLSKRLMVDILNGNIPELEKTLSGLSFLSTSSLPGDTACFFFEPLFEEINKYIASSEATILVYFSLLDVLNNIVEISPERAIESINKIRNNTKNDEIIEIPLWGERNYTWEKLLTKCYQLLIKISSNITQISDAKRLLMECCDLLSEGKFEDKDKLRHEIKRLITGRKNSSLFISAVDRIMASDAFEKMDWDFKATLFKGMLSPERERIEQRSFSAITIIQYQISPSISGWDSFIKAREILISLLGDSEFNNIRQRMDLWNILIQSHRECNYILTVKAIADEVMKDAYYDIIESDLEKANAILSNNSNIPLEEKTCMKELWWWQLEKGKDTALIKLAEQNENIVTDASSWDFAELFRMRYSKEKNEVAEKIAIQLSEVDTTDKFNLFFEECEKYLIGKEYRCGYQGALSDLAFYLIMKYDNCATTVNEFLIDTFNGNISQNKARSYFGVNLASRVLKKKKTEGEDAVIQLNKYIEASSNPADLLYLLYSNASSRIIGDLSESEFAVIIGNQASFDNDIKKWFLIMAEFSIDFWDKINASELKEKLGDNHEDAIEVLKLYIDSLHIATIRSDNKTPKKENLDWIIDCIADNDLPGDVFDENFHSYRSLIEKCDYKMSLSQFLKLIDSRIRLREKSTGSVTLLPHDFLPENWVEFNGESDKEDFMSLCELCLNNGYFNRHSLPKYLSQLDRSGQQVLSFIERKISNSASFESLAVLSSFASGYSEWSEEWLKIIDLILPVCEDELKKDERFSIYFNLSEQDTEAFWVGSPESITKVEKIKEDEEAKKVESMQNGFTHRDEFHDWRIRRAESDIEFRLKAAKEREWEN